MMIEQIFLNFQEADDGGEEVGEDLGDEDEVEVVLGLLTLIWLVGVPPIFRALNVEML